LTTYLGYPNMLFIMTPLTHRHHHHHHAMSVSAGNHG
jgi:hypothetical protein